MLETIGIIGALLILIAWIMGLVDELRSRKNLIELRFSMISLVGTTILFYYAYSIGDLVFQFLNGGIFVVIIFEILYTYHVTR